MLIARHRGAALGILLFASSCAPIQPAIGSGDDFGWRRVESDHFVVESNVDDEGFLRKTAADFETLRSAFLAVPYLGKSPPEGRATVVVLAKAREFDFFSKKRSGAGPTPTACWGRSSCSPSGRTPSGRAR